MQHADPWGRFRRRCGGWLGRLALAGILGLGGATGLILASPAQAAEPIPAELFFRPPSVLSASLSPDGQRLALTSEVKGRVGLFTVDLQAAELKFAAVALFNDADILDFNWVGNERLLYRVIDLKSGGGLDQRIAPGLFSARFDGAETRMLVERQGRPWVTNGARVRSLPWNHELLHVPPPAAVGEGVSADEVIVGRLVFGTDDLQDIVPLWLNVRTGRTRELAGLADAPSGVVRWWFGPRGEPRAVISRDRGRGRDALHWFHPPAGDRPGRWVRLAAGPLFGVPYFPAWVGEGDALYVTWPVGPAGELVLAPFDFATGRPGEPLVRVPGFDFAGRVLADESGRQPLGVRVDADAEQTVWFDAGRRALQAGVDQALPGRVNRIDCRRCDAQDAVVLVHSWSDRHPGQWLLRQPRAGEGGSHWRSVALQQPGIDPARMASVSFERFRARDGREVPVWLTRPAGVPADQALPAVVLVHGGPWVRQGHWRWDPQAQFLASRGYLVIEPEFRGSTGYGRAHERAGFRQFGQAMQDDVSDALLWARQRGWASDKACIVGASYGGYSTLMGLIRTPELYRCGSAWFAVADLLLLLEGGWFVSDDISGAGRRHVLPERVGDPDKDREMLLAHSPVAQAHRLRTPLQLVWGTDDLRVPIDHGKRLRSAMRAAGLPDPEWIEYQGEAHGLRTVENRVDFARRLEAFLARHLK